METEAQSLDVVPGAHARVDLSIVDDRESPIRGVRVEGENVDGINDAGEINVQQLAQEGQGWHTGLDELVGIGDGDDVFFGEPTLGPKRLFVFEHLRGLVCVVHPQNALDLGIAGLRPLAIEKLKLFLNDLGFVPGNGKRRAAVVRFFSVQSHLGSFE